MSRPARLGAPIGPRALIPCRVTVTEPGRRVHYDGLFRSTSDAVLDAMDRFPALRSVSAKPRGKQR